MLNLPEYLSPLPVGDEESITHVDNHYRMYTILVKARREIEAPNLTEEEKAALLLELDEVFRFFLAPGGSVQDIIGRVN